MSASVRRGSPLLANSANASAAAMSLREGSGLDRPPASLNSEEMNDSSSSLGSPEDGTGAVDPTSGGDAHMLAMDACGR